MKVLVIAPHADDEVFGMGATIAKLRSQGHEVLSVVVCCGDSFGFHHLGGKSVSREERYQEMLAVASALDTGSMMLRFTQDSFMDTIPIREVIGELERVQREFAADRWYVAGPSFHQDHRVVFEAAMAAGRISWNNSPKEIYLYELPMYSMNHAPWTFEPHVWEEVTEFIDTKISATYLYASQVRASGPLSPESLRNWALTCGSECGVTAAERFQVIRAIR